MRIAFVDIQNFRKLKSIRIEFSKQTTLFVGANNCGKTSAMLALGHFLINPRRFTTNDFTLSNWNSINAIGSELTKDRGKEAPPELPLARWIPSVPILDVWLEVATKEIHFAREILPTLDWSGGFLGVRLRFEPEKVEELYKEFIAAFTTSKSTKKLREKKAAGDKLTELRLWPETMRDFLDRRLDSFFVLRSYLLDPTKKDIKIDGTLTPQLLPDDAEAVEGHPLKELIRIDEIAAQRGFGSAGTSDEDAADEQRPIREGRKLSEQLRQYYTRHLDPLDSPDPTDLEALEAIETSQRKFDERLAIGFASALEELQSLNYPGVSDPKLKIATRLRPTEGLNHSGAVQFEVVPEDGKEVMMPLRLPEEYNGLGYQNLISMVFKLMSFRDAWMRVGKASNSSKDQHKEEYSIKPLHLVLIEEPEAHLHAQVQQVFLRQAYDVLRKRPELKNNDDLQTQLVVSTHSSHIAHEAQFSALRYFRRLPPDASCCVPTSEVINLSSVFGPNDETEKFVTRYLRATHCDLFFADAAILLEGPSERILVPHFIRTEFKDLNRCYVTLLEIGGSHAHRLKPLIEHLGLTTLIITDIDSVESTGHRKSIPPKRRAGLLSGNATLNKWHPEKQSLDELLDLDAGGKIKNYKDPQFAIRVAYQTPVKVNYKNRDETALATTFEDALIFENLELFASVESDGVAEKFKKAVLSCGDISKLSDTIFRILEDGKIKAPFALELLISAKKQTGEPVEKGEPDAALEKLKIPTYIREGLQWLEQQFVKKKQEVLASATPVAAK